MKREQYQRSREWADPFMSEKRAGFQPVYLLHFAQKRVDVENLFSYVYSLTMVIAAGLRLAPSIGWKLHQCTFQC